jgi:hypothetical protein
VVHRLTSLVHAHRNSRRREQKGLLLGRKLPRLVQGRAVDGIRPATTDWIGVAVSLTGMAIIIFGPRAPS